MTGIVATAVVDIDAPSDRVWDALIDPRKIKRYLFGSNVETDWKPGSPIVWRGKYNGKRYEDKGLILDVAPSLRLRMTHFSPLSGQPDVPESYHTLTYELDARGNQTRLSLSQDNNADEVEARHSADSWQHVLSGVKDLVEHG